MVCGEGRRGDEMGEWKRRLGSSVIAGRSFYKTPTVAL